MFNRGWGVLMVRNIIFLLFSYIIASHSLQIVPMERTPQSNSVIVRIAYPENTSSKKANPIWVQVRLQGYALGTDSQFPRAKQVANSDRGQSLHIVVDNKPYFPVSGPGIDPYDEIGDYFEESYKFLLPFDLKEGSHTLRVYCARSFGESLKNESSFDAVNFFVGKKESDSNVDLRAPMLTYNEPSMRFFYEEGLPILLDFFLSNCELSSDGFKVKVTIDDSYSQVLTSWQPYYIYGLKRGKHKIMLELIDVDGNLSSGSYNSSTRSFIVH
jgi:hypothetical protein